MQVSYNTIGRAYEYAWMQVLYEELSVKRKTRVVNNKSLNDNKRAWDNLDEDKKRRFIISARSALGTILELEPLMSENGEDELLLEFQKDEVGIAGDVRDIVVKRESIDWEVGLSIKHNHEAIKHSRLSYSLDFGREWFGIPCSKNYWLAVSPIFTRLKQEKYKGTKWSDLPDKENGVYIPLLQAFMDEVIRSYKTDIFMVKRMVEYLIGTKDYYKIVSNDRYGVTVVSPFNPHNTLNNPSQVKVSKLSVPTLILPTELVELKFKPWSNNTVEMFLNNGWSLSFRIHNASAKVEPSLKFDIQFIAMPDSIQKIRCKWK